MLWMFSSQFPPSGIRCCCCSPPLRTQQFGININNFYFKIQVLNILNIIYAEAINIMLNMAMLNFI